MMLVGATAFSQTIPGTDGITNATPNNNERCSNCVFDGWTKGLQGGTPDISSRTQAASSSNAGPVTPNTTGWTAADGKIGSDAHWTIDGSTAATLPAPPTGQELFVSIRDLGANTQGGYDEDVKTTIDNLIVGKKYVLTLYSLTARTLADGQSPPPQYNWQKHKKETKYSGKYMDYFIYKIGDNGAELEAVPGQNVWAENKIEFVATATSMPIYFYPRNNSQVQGNIDFNLVESVLISVSANAVELKDGSVSRINPSIRMRATIN